MIHTPETLYTEILNNPGISNKELSERFLEREEHRALRESLDELRWQQKIITVKYTMWSLSAYEVYRYFPIDRGGVTVFGIERNDYPVVLEYDPFETCKKALDEA